MKNLARWLSSLPGMKTMRPCRVLIGKGVWEGAEYEQEFQPPEGAGKKDAHINRAIYLIGDRPKAHQRSGRTCFREEATGSDYYICCYWHGLSNEHQPFGSNYIIKKWDAERPIDYGETPYKRIPMVIEYLREENL